MSDLPDGFYLPEAPISVTWPKRYKWDAENRPVEDTDAAALYRVVPAPKPSARVSPSVRERTLLRDDYKCRYCGAAPAGTIDHLTPRVRGGGNAMGNLAACCSPCNLAKGSMTEDEFREWIVTVYKHYIGRNQ
jgi:5-methylcytosine-specific restriction endonuclease McrA